MFVIYLSVEYYIFNVSYRFSYFFQRYLLLMLIAFYFNNLDYLIRNKQISEYILSTYIVLYNDISYTSYHFTGTLYCILLRTGNRFRVILAIYLLC